MKLYDCTKAPNPRRVRIFLAEKGIDVEKVEIDIAGGENLGADFKVINPRGMLPTLVLDDGTCFDETVAICRYFEEIQPDPPLLGTDAKSKALIESRQRQMELDGLASVADVFRNSHPAFANRGLQGVENVAAINSLVERGTAATQRFFDRLNAILSESQYVAGDGFSIADITAICAVDFAKWVKLRLGDEHAHSRRWYQEVAVRPSMTA